MNFKCFLATIIVSSLVAISTGHAAEKKSPRKAPAAQKVTKVKKAPAIPSQITKYLVYRSREHDQVRALQLALTKAGYAPGPIDGLYRKQVQVAMQRLQSDLNLVADGCHVGKISRDYLNAVLRGKSPMRLVSSRQVAVAVSVVLPTSQRCFASCISKDNTVWSTKYKAGEKHSDADTDAGRTSTGISVRIATAKQIGVVAGDPELIRQGSLLEKLDDKGKVVLRYLFGDTGGGVFSQVASGGKYPVVDFYGMTEHKGNFRIVPYTGAIPYQQLKLTEKLAMLKLENWKTGKYRSPVKPLLVVAL